MLEELPDLIEGFADKDEFERILEAGGGRACGLYPFQELRGDKT